MHANKLTCFTMSLLILASSTAASDFLFGIGQDDVDGSATEVLSIQLEYHTNPVRKYHWGTVSGMLVTQADDTGSIYAGVGLSSLWNTSKKWFFEGSLAVGYYDKGNEVTDLGGNLQFRTLVGFGYRVSDRTRLSIAIDHLSNASIQTYNPGREDITIRLGVQF